MRIAVAQPLTVAYDLKANVAAHAAAVRQAQARVVVFPELSLTGYHYDAEAVSPTDSLLAPLIEACAEMKSVVLAGAPTSGGPFISMLAIDGSGATVAYRKMWLGDEEAKWFAPGNSPGILKVDGWRLGLAICKDAGVTQHAADTAAAGMDLYLAGTVKFPDEVALQDERARNVATTHQVWVAISSAAGANGEGYTATAGHSGIWRPDGSLAAQGGPQSGEIASSEVSHQAAA